MHTCLPRMTLLQRPLGSNNGSSARAGCLTLPVFSPLLVLFLSGAVGHAHLPSMWDLDAAPAWFQ
jgi:hypothetical protein